MPASKAEQVLDALKTLLEMVPDAVVERNRVLPEKIPDGGLVILRDGDPGEPEQALAGFGNTYYRHAVEIEVYVEEGDAAARDAAFDDILQQIGAVLEADPTLGGLAFGLTYGRPEPATEAIAGAPAIKSATLSADRRLRERRTSRLITEHSQETTMARAYSNNLEKIETIRDDGLIEGADPTIAALTGRIDVRFADTTLIDLAAGGTPVDLEFAYTLSAQAKLVLTAHEVYLPKPKLAVEGPGGVQASFDFRGAKNTAAGRMLTVTLTNDLDGTAYL